MTTPERKPEMPITDLKCGSGFNEKDEGVDDQQEVLEAKSQAKHTHNLKLKTQGGELLEDCGSFPLLLNARRT
jgi:hypothetical protein